MKLGFLCERMSNSHYRVIIPMRELERRGHTVVWPDELDDDVPLRELITCDLVHCYRRLDRRSDLRTLSHHGVAVSFDNDDDFVAAEVSDGGSGLEGHLYNRRLAAQMLDTARRADLVTTPSPLLASQYGSAGIGRVAVIENHLERDMLGFGSGSEGSEVVVGWIAAREHRLDLARLPIAEHLARLLDLHPRLRVLTVGVSLPLRSQRYEHIKEVAFRDILTVTSRMDIGIAPLADTQFNRSRSNSKLKEYASGGALWLASPVGPYVGLGEMQGGLLVDDSEWFATVDQLIRSPRRRRRLARRALKWARSQTIDQFASSWEGHFLDAIDRTQARVANPRTRS
jgi:hypothetical protein